jgi:hypothetical protein
MSISKAQAADSARDPAAKSSKEERPGRELQERFERHLRKKTAPPAEEQQDDDALASLAWLMAMPGAVLPNALRQQARDQSARLPGVDGTASAFASPKMAGQDEAIAAGQLTEKTPALDKAETWQGRVANGEWAGVELVVSQHAGRLMLSARAANEKQYQQLREVKKSVDVQLQTMFNGSVSFEVTCDEHRPTR